MHLILNGVPTEKCQKVEVWFQMTLWPFKCICDVWKCLGPSSQTCTTINSSLDSGLEPILSLLSKASVARNTWGSLCTVAANTCQVHFRIIISSFCFYFMVFPFLKAVSRYSHSGAAPRRVTGSPLHCAESQEKLRMLWTRQRPFGTNKWEGLSNGKDLSHRTFADQCTLCIGKNFKVVHIDLP